MSMKKRVLTLFVSTLIVFTSAGPAMAAVALPGAPTVIAPTEGAGMDDALPTITALAHEGTRVAVYIDDAFNGYATVVSTEGGVQSVVYKPFLPLAQGPHTVMMRAEDLNAGTRSVPSAKVSFWVEQPLPSPTLFTPVVNEETTWEQPWIVGVAPSSSPIQFWIDGVADGGVSATDDDSGVGSFAYKPSGKLSRGTHTVVAQAVATRADYSVKESAHSAARTIVVAPPAPAEVATEETPVDTEEVAVVTEAVTETEAAPESAPDPTPAPAEEPTAEVVETEEGSEEDNVVSEEDEETVEEQVEEAEEGNSTARTVLGWVLLVVAAAILASRFRGRGGKGGGTPTGGSPEKKDQPSTPEGNNSQPQLELHAPTENKNIEVVSKETPKETPPSDNSGNTPTQSNP